jgi:hypothetical protein
LLFFPKGRISWHTLRLIPGSRYVILCPTRVFSRRLLRADGLDENSSRSHRLSVRIWRISRSC